MTPERKGYWVDTASYAGEALSLDLYRVVAYETRILEGEGAPSYLRVYLEGGHEVSLVATVTHDMFADWMAGAIT